MRILGADLPRTVAAGTAGTHTLVLLGDDGATAEVLYASTLPELAAHVGRLAAGDPFLLGVNVPVVVPGKPARVRPVESLVRRRLG